MNFFRSFLEQMQELQKQSSPSAKVGIGVAAVLCLAVIIGVGIWSSQPNYVPLAMNLEPAEAADIISKLNNAGIKTSSNYTTVLVDKSQWDQANMLVADLVPDSQRAPADFEASTFRDPKMNAYYQQQHLEKKISSAITRFKSVDQAVVHLNIAKEENFMRTSESSSASVVLTLRPGMVFTPRQTQSVVATVASAVKGLSPDEVKVVDTNGNLLSGGESRFGGVVSEQYDIRRKMEADLAEQAQWVLERRLGPGKAIVRVSVDLDFTESTTVETSHPESVAKISEKTTKDTESLDDGSASGAAGTASNLRSSRGGLGTVKPVVFESETTDVTYAQGEVTQTIQEAPGKIRRLTVAAMVDLTPSKPVADADVDPNADPAADATTAADPAADATADTMTLDDVEQLIRAAVGFDEERYDEIKVVQTRLEGDDVLTMFDEPANETFALYSEIARNASLGIAGLFALVTGFLMIRKIKPVTIMKETPQAISPERARRLTEMATLAKQHPDAMASIMAAWLNEPNKTTESETSAAPTAARRAA